MTATQYTTALLFAVGSMTQVSMALAIDAVIVGSAVVPSFGVARESAVEPLVRSDTAAALTGQAQVTLAAESADAAGQSDANTGAALSPNFKPGRRTWIDLTED